MCGEPDAGSIYALPVVPEAAPNKGKAAAEATDKAASSSSAVEPLKPSDTEADNAMSDSDKGRNRLVEAVRERVWRLRAETDLLTRGVFGSGKRLPLTADLANLAARSTAPPARVSLLCTADAVGPEGGVRLARFAETKGDEHVFLSPTLAEGWHIELDGKRLADTQAPVEARPGAVLTVAADDGSAEEHYKVEKAVAHVSA